MDNYKDNAALSVHWIWVGPDGRTTRPDTGGVLPYYTMCSEEADRHVKTIVNTYFLEGVDIHPHNFRYRCVTAQALVLQHTHVLLGVCSGCMMTGFVCLQFPIADSHRSH